MFFLNCASLSWYKLFFLLRRLRVRFPSSININICSLSGLFFCLYIEKVLISVFYQLAGSIKTTFSWFGVRWRCVKWQNNLLSKLNYGRFQ